VPILIEVQLTRKPMHFSINRESAAVVECGQKSDVQQHAYRPATRSPKCRTGTLPSHRRYSPWNAVSLPFDEMVDDSRGLRWMTCNAQRRVGRGSRHPRCQSLYYDRRQCVRTFAERRLNDRTDFRDLRRRATVESQDACSCKNPRWHTIRPRAGACAYGWPLSWERRRPR
jgi:hypothetical protein